MKIVEHRLHGFQWADPLQGLGFLKVEKEDASLRITGLFPRNKAADVPWDSIREFERARRRGAESPDLHFANADSDEKLVDFVRRFGPVVAKDVHFIPFQIPIEVLTPVQQLPEPPPLELTAHQDLGELRNEHSIYRAGLHLVLLLMEDESDFDNKARVLIRQISTGIADWPRQWERERSQRGFEPIWKVSGQAIERIEAIGWGQRRLEPVDARIVICELVNSFPGRAFPNPLEVHSGIKYGIRPLLYSLLRRQFFAFREIAACANTQCRNLFNVDRSGKKFCSVDCSQKQRQRSYWKKSGKKRRQVRLKKRKKAAAVALGHGPIGAARSA